MSKKSSAEGSPPQQIMDGDRMIRNLPVKLTPHELAERADRLAELVDRKGTTIAARSEAVSKFNGEVKEIEAEIKDVSKMIMTKTEIREVECVAVKDLEKQVLYIRRTDTDEVVDSRRLQVHELQMELPRPDPATLKSNAPEAGAGKKPSSPRSGGRGNLRPVKGPGDQPTPMEAAAPLDGPAAEYLA